MFAKCHTETWGRGGRGGRIGGTVFDLSLMAFMSGRFFIVCGVEKPEKKKEPT